MAELKQEFVVAQPREKVWAVFQDIETVVGCLPGASLTEPPTPNHAKGRMTVKLGPVKANFAGEADIERDEAGYTGVIKGSGIDKSQGSRAKGNVRYALEEADGGGATKVVVAVDYTLSGALAQFSRGGIVEAVAAKLTEDFAANLEAELSGGDAAADAQPTSSAAGGGEPKGEPRSGKASGARSNELNALSLIGAVVKGWFRRLFGAK
ncbi:SRPBCC family protein [Nitratireductor sp. GCM10026969]|uniref:SRPBCC family protein n=1 Tax=Nitratireductor sp. GCM10026969 TaxID=3252645 RepID=UPI0036109AF4